MLVVVVQGLRDILKSPRRQQVSVAHRVVFVEDILGEEQLMIEDGLSPEDLDTQASAVQDETALPVVVQDTGLILTAVCFHRSIGLEGVFLHHHIVAADDTGAGFLGSF